MVNERYSIAMAETLYYLKGINQDDVNKIPNSFMNFLKENASKNYECDFDYTRPLKELNLRDETRGLIGLICLNYWCETEEEKIKFKEHLNKNEKLYQEELRKKYNPDNIFKNNTKPRVVEQEASSSTLNENTASNTQLSKIKENIFQKIIRKIKMIFSKKG